MSVTCPACREYARDAYLGQAESAERLLEWYDKEPELMARACAEAHVTPAGLAQCCPRGPRNCREIRRPREASPMITQPTVGELIKRGAVLAAPGAA